MVLTQPHLLPHLLWLGQMANGGEAEGEGPRDGGMEGWRARAGSDGCGDSMGIPELILVSYLV